MNEHECIELKSNNALFNRAKIYYDKNFLTWRLEQTIDFRSFRIKACPFCGILLKKEECRFESAEKDNLCLVMDEGDKERIDRLEKDLSKLEDRVKFNFDIACKNYGKITERLDKLEQGKDNYITDIYESLKTIRTKIEKLDERIDRLKSEVSDLDSYKEHNIVIINHLADRIKALEDRNA